MNRSPQRSYKLALLALALVCLAGVARFQQALNRQREDPQLGLLRMADLGSNAPPALAFTTVALGGFRGLIANALWMRAQDLQTDGKYFEMVQLADWITKLEPTFNQVWVVQAWNMTYNISVKFNDPADRWRWVQRGIELLRDQGLRYCPKEALLYRELAWFYQHKIGQNLDDAHLYYKTALARDMQAALGGPRPNFDELLKPRTDAARARVQRLREAFRMEPEIMKQVDDQFGPLEWRLPDAHAIYWAWVGLQNSKKKDLLTLRRVIYQSMSQSVMRGRLYSVEPLRYGPDLDKVDRARAAYEQMIKEDTEMGPAIKLAHRSFLREVIYLLYTHNRLAKANELLQYCHQTYPDLIDPKLSLDEFALKRLTQEIGMMSQDRIRLVVTGLIYQHYLYLALDEDDRAAGYERMSRQLWSYFDERISNRRDPLQFPPLEENEGHGAQRRPQAGDGPIDSRTDRPVAHALAHTRHRHQRRRQRRQYQQHRQTRQALMGWLASAGFGWQPAFFNGSFHLVAAIIGIIQSDRIFCGPSLAKCEARSAERGVSIPHSALRTPRLIGGYPNKYRAVYRSGFRS